MRTKAAPIHDDTPRFTVGSRAGNVVEIARSRTTGSAPAAAWSDARMLSDVLHRAFDEGAVTVVVDLEGTGEASTSLLAVLIDGRIRARATGTEFVVRVSPALRHLARICRVERAVGMT